MATVAIVSLPAAYHKIPPRVWPACPPPFPDGAPTAQDVALARELVAALDPWSRKWYAARFERFRDLAPRSQIANEADA